MKEISVIIVVFAWIFIVAILFVSLNTVFVGQIIPTLNDVAQDTSFVNYERYTEKEALYKTVFYGVFFIMGALPFIWLLVRLLYKREPSPSQGVYYNAVRI